MMRLLLLAAVLAAVQAFGTLSGEPKPSPDPEFSLQTEGNIISPVFRDFGEYALGIRATEGANAGVPYCPCGYKAMKLKKKPNKKNELIVKKGKCKKALKYVKDNLDPDIEPGLKALNKNEDAYDHLEGCRYREAKVLRYELSVPCDALGRCENQLRGQFDALCNDTYCGELNVPFKPDPANETTLSYWPSATQGRSGEVRLVVLNGRSAPGELKTVNEIKKGDWLRIREGEYEVKDIPKRPAKMFYNKNVNADGAENPVPFGDYSMVCSRVKDPRSMDPTLNLNCQERRELINPGFCFLQRGQNFTPKYPCELLKDRRDACLNNPPAGVCTWRGF